MKPRLRLQNGLWIADVLQRRLFAVPERDRAWRLAAMWWHKGHTTV